MQRTPASTPKAGRPSAENITGFDAEILLSILFHGKRLLLITLVATVGFTALFSLISPRVYESTAKVMAEPPKENNPYLIQAASFQDRRAFFATQKELVVSESVLRDALATLKKLDPETLADREVEAFARKVSVLSRAALGKSLFNSDGFGESNTFFISVRAGDPNDAAEEASALVAAYLKASARVRREQAEAALAALRLTIDNSTAETKAAHGKLVTFEKTTGPLLNELINVDKETVRIFPELQGLRASFEDTKIAVQAKTTLVEQLQEGLEVEEGTPVIPSEVIASNPTLNLLRSKEVELTLELNEVLPFFQPTSREVSSLQEKLASIRHEVRKEITLYIEGERRSLAVLEATQETRAQTLAEYDIKMTELSGLNSEYAELKREYQARARALDTHIESYAQASAARAQTDNAGANIAVIDHPRVNKNSVSPKIMRNILISIPVGVGLGLLLVLLSYMLNPVFVHPRQVHLTTGVPVVAVMRNEGANS